MSTDSQSPRQNRGFVVAAIVVGVIALAAIVLLGTFLFRGGDNNADPTPTPAPTASATANADPSVCGLDGFEETSSLDAAPDNKWELVGTVASPTDPAAGPGEVDGTFRSCYAHTAEGALFASVNYLALSTDDRNRADLWQLLADGPIKDQVKEAGQSPSDSTTSTRLQVAGFKINSYTPEEAVVDVAYTVTSQGGALVSVPTVLRWQDGDWKVVLSDSGAPIKPSQLTNLGGYIPWAGA